METLFRTLGTKAGYTDEILFEANVYTSQFWDKAYDLNSQKFGKRLDCRISFAQDGQALMLVPSTGVEQARSLIATAVELATQ